jgi:zinc protease
MNKCLYIFALLSLLLVSSCTSISSMPLTNSTSPDQLRYQPLKFSPPKAHRVALRNGIILHILEDNEIPLVTISAVIRSGSGHDPLGKEGLAGITVEVMRTGGTISLSGNAVDEALDFIAGTLTMSANRDYVNVNLSVLKKDVDEGLKILAQILQSPAFTVDKLNHAKALKIEALRRINDDPQKLAFREFNRLMYQNNPRGRLPTISSVETIQREDLFEFHRRFFYPENIMMTITGDMAGDESLHKMNQYFGMWDKVAVQTPIMPVPMTQKGGIYFLTKDLPQSIIIHGNLAPAKKNIDSYAFEILDFIIGSGGFRSRIFQEVRSNLGLAYSAGSFYRGKSDYGIFGAYAITSAETTATVLSSIQSIIHDIRKNPISDRDLEWSKNAINNSFIFSFSSAEQIAQQQMMNECDKLPDDYLLTFRDKIEKVRADDILKVANKYLSFEDAIILVVGNDKVYNLLKNKFCEIYKIGGTL